MSNVSTAGAAPAGLALTSVGFILARVFFAGLPDKLGGARVALVCVLIEAVGQWLIWTSVTPMWAYAGACLTGAGYSLAFPAFDVEAVAYRPGGSPARWSASPAGPRVTAAPTECCLP